MFLVQQRQPAIFPNNLLSTNGDWVCPAPPPGGCPASLKKNPIFLSNMRSMVLAVTKKKPGDDDSSQKPTHPSAQVRSENCLCRFFVLHAKVAESPSGEQEFGMKSGWRWAHSIVFSCLHVLIEHVFLFGPCFIKNTGRLMCIIGPSHYFAMGESSNDHRAVQAVASSVVGQHMPNVDHFLVNTLFMSHKKLFTRCIEHSSSTCSFNLRRFL